jgi:hypothetical protein
METKPGFNFQNITLLVLAFLLALCVVALVWTVNVNNNLKGSNNTQQDSIQKLKYNNKLFSLKLDSLEDKSAVLEEEILQVREEKDKLLAQKDSIQKLLDFSRVNERNSQAKVAQLQKKLAELQGKLDGVQKKYDALLAQSGSTGEGYELRIRQLTDERNELASENQKLKQDLLAATGNADNRTAIFTTKMSLTPGEVKKGKFSGSTKSQNTDRIEVNFKLSRAPKPTENLIFKVFDYTNKEINVKPKYRNELNAPADPTNQKVVLEFEAGYLDKRATGNYSVRLYLTDVNKGLENQEIGLATFTMK